MNKVFIAGAPEGRAFGAHSKFSASEELLTAAALARLGVNTTFMTRLNGEYDGELLDVLRKSGADERGVLPANGGGLCAEDFAALDLSDYRYVFFTGAFPAGSETALAAAKALTERARECSAPLVFDPDMSGIPAEKRADYKELINEFACGAEVFVPNLDEVKALCGLTEPEEIAAHYIARGTKKLVIKLGKGGAFFMSAKEYGTAPTFRAEPVDISGTGSAFAAGILSGLCEELPLGEAVFRANALASMQIQFSGDNDTMPTMEQLRGYMLDHRFVVDGCKEI